MSTIFENPSPNAAPSRPPEFADLEETEPLERASKPEDIAPAPALAPRPADPVAAAAVPSDLLPAPPPPTLAHDRTAQEAGPQGTPRAEPHAAPIPVAPRVTVAEQAAPRPAETTAFGVAIEPTRPTVPEAQPSASAATPENAPPLRKTSPQLPVHAAISAGSRQADAARSVRPIESGPDQQPQPGFHQPPARQVEPREKRQALETHDPAPLVPKPEALPFGAHAAAAATGSAVAYEGRPTPLSSRTEAPLTTTIEAAAPAAAIAAPPAPRAAGPAEIALRLGGPRDQEIEIRVRENASAVDVVVRGRDPELTKDLRSQLGDLVARLEDRGYEAKTWIPGEPARAELRAEKPAAELASGGRDDSPNSRHEQQGQPGGRRDREQRQPRPHWLERFEHTFREEARQ